MERLVGRTAVVIPTVRSRALKRLEVPEDLVGACIFPASPESDFITGQTWSSMAGRQ